MVKNKDAEKNNPCLKETELSLKCLENNNYEKEKCEYFFTNYKNCREFWSKVRSSRRSLGITPYLPDVEDRAKIKADYLKTNKKI